MRADRKNNSGNFSRAKAASRYYSYGAYAARIEDARDNVSLKYYGRQIRKEEKTNRLLSLKKILTAVVISTCCIATVFAKSAAINYKIGNERLKAELDEQIYKTESMVMANKQNIDLARVEEIAINQLNMAKPQMYQKVYINVPKSDYTVVYDSPPPVEKEKTRFADFLRFFAAEESPK